MYIDRLTQAVTFATEFYDFTHVNMLVKVISFLPILKTGLLNMQISIYNS